MHTKVENMAILVPGFVGVISAAVSVPSAAVSIAAAVAVHSAVPVTATVSVGDGAVGHRAVGRVVIGVMLE